MAALNHPYRDNTEAVLLAARPPRVRPARALLLSLLSLGVLLAATTALAQDLPPPISANNPNPAGVLAWCSFAYVVVGSLVSALRPDNTALPFRVPQSVRVAILAVGTVVLACLLAILNGTPWVQAVVAAAGTMLATYVQAAKRTGSPGGQAGQAKTTA